MRRHLLLLLSAFLLLAVATSTASPSESSGNSPTNSDDEDMNEGSASGFGEENDYVEEPPVNHDDNVPTERTFTAVTDEDMYNKEKEVVPKEEEEGPYTETEEIDIEIELTEDRKVGVDRGFEGKVKTGEEQTPYDIDQDQEVLKTSSVFESGHFLTAAIIGGCIGFLFAVALIMLLLYRMRKKDEGSYALDDQKKHGAPPAYQYTQGQEYYA